MAQADTTITAPATNNKSGKTKPRTTGKPAAGKPSSNSKPGAPARRFEGARQVVTLELVKHYAPTDSQAEKLSRTFGLEPVDYAAIRETTEEMMVKAAQALTDNLNDRAIEIHLQRIAGSFVQSAHGATQFYQTKVTAARDATAASANDHRDHDRDGVAGFESKAERARIFAAEMGLQAYALIAAAEGAIHAYSHMTGEDWKPYIPPNAPASSTARRSANEELDAFNG